MKNPSQLSLPLTRDQDHLADSLRRVTGRTVSLTVTDNSTSMISVRGRGRTLLLRLHRIFLDAGDEVISEIAVFMKRKKGPTPLLRDFLKKNMHRVGKASPRMRVRRTAGRYHDLAETFTALNREYFDGRISAAITWGAGRPKYAVRKRTLGSYSKHMDVIRINPVLDRRRVPRYFIEHVVYHEMLHADMGTSEHNGRRLVHSKEFRERERMFVNHDKAMAWEKGRNF